MTQYPDSFTLTGASGPYEYMNGMYMRQEALCNGKPLYVCDESSVEDKTAYCFFQKTENQWLFTSDRTSYMNEQLGHTELAYEAADALIPFIPWKQHAVIYTRNEEGDFTPDLKIKKID